MYYWVLMMSEKKKAPKKKAKTWALTGFFVMIAAIIGAYKFVYGYLIQMTWNEDGTGKGTSKPPDELDVIMFLGIVALGLAGFTILLFNIVRLLKK
ncbi:hypothetical protein AAY42_10890 [Flagellimonas eckloniae]|uniref:Uncharacterized protein n=2 Tax=Flagellimonas eckloniae TaxID=346185 RepID=A0A0Q1CHC1_9FLAO|nr:hypothetical protein AAY42_10890 [Allomuricauda eckloniae]